MALGITFSAGNKVTGAQLQAIVNQVDSLTAPTWTSYTPVWTMTGSAPTQGNATLTGRWRRAANSDLIIVEGIWTFGSTSSIGTGAIRMSLPTNASAGAQATPTLGAARVNDASAQFWTATCFPVTASTLQFLGNSGTVTNTWTTWATGDSITWTIAYEPA